MTDPGTLETRAFEALRAVLDECDENRDFHDGTRCSAAGGSDCDGCAREDFAADIRHAITAALTPPDEEN